MTVASPAWTPRLYRAGDDERILALFTAAFDGWPKVEIDVAPIDHLRWKLSSSVDAPRYQAVAEAGGQIVGFRGYLIERVKLRDRIVRARYGVDHSVHPDYQRRGVMESIQRSCDPHLDLHFGARSGHPGIRRISAKRQPGKHTFGAPVQALVRPTAQPEVDGPSPQAEADAPFTITEALRFDRRVDALFDEASRPFEFIVVRDADHLNWRYADPRAGSFTILLAEEGDRVLGYTVIRRSHGRGHIADALALPGRNDIIRALVGESVRRFRDAGLSSIECWLPKGHTYEPVLADLGFIDKRRKVVFNYLALRLPEIEVEFLRSPDAPIHVTSGDTDLI